MSRCNGQSADPDDKRRMGHWQQNRRVGRIQVQFLHSKTGEIWLPQEVSVRIRSIRATLGNRSRTKTKVKSGDLWYVQPCFTFKPHLSTKPTPCHLEASEKTTTARYIQVEDVSLETDESRHQVRMKERTTRFIGFPSVSVARPRVWDSRDSRFVLSRVWVEAEENVIQSASTCAGGWTSPAPPLHASPPFHLRPPAAQVQNTAASSVVRSDHCSTSRTAEEISSFQQHFKLAEFV